MRSQHLEKDEAPAIGPAEASENSPQSRQSKEFSMNDSKAIESSSQPVFNFGEHKVRVVVREGEPWFVASDVCAALGYKNVSQTIGDHLDADERMISLVLRTPIDSIGVETNTINESGLYALVLRSRKPEARKFAKWVTSEVLPAIRKTGVYVGKPFTVNPGDVLTQDEQNTLRIMLKSAVERLPKEKQGAAMMQGWSKLKAHYGVPYREIPRQEFSEAVSIVARHVAQWELADEIPMQMQPIADECRTKAAFDAASRAGAHVQSSVFNAVLGGNDDWKHDRWLLAFIDDSAKVAPAYVRQMERGAFATTWPRLVKDVANGECMCSSAELLDMASACMHRLQQRKPANEKSLSLPV